MIREPLTPPDGLGGRLEGALSLLELEWDLAQTRRDKRLIVEIGPTAIRTLR